MNEKVTLILTPVYDEEDAPYIYPDGNDLETYQRRQFYAWGIEALERQLWDSAQRGWHDTSGPEFQSYLKMLRSIKMSMEDKLAYDNSKILDDEMLEKASMMS
jgi:hypothetical protein